MYYNFQAFNENYGTSIAFVLNKTGVLKKWIWMDYNRNNSSKSLWGQLVQFLSENKVNFSNSGHSDKTS